MYDENLLQEAMAIRGLSFYQISRATANDSTGLSPVDPKTVKAVVMTGKAKGQSVYRVAKVLGFKVKPNDLTAVIKRRSPEELANGSSQLASDNPTKPEIRRDSKALERPSERHFYMECCCSRPIRHCWYCGRNYSEHPPDLQLESQPREAQG